MFKGLKKLFVYEDPFRSQKKFRFPEEASESSRWDNLMRQKENNSNQKNEENNRGSNQNSLNDQNNTNKNNPDKSEEEAAQINVYKNLVGIIKNSQQAEAGNQSSKAEGQFTEISQNTKADDLKTINISKADVSKSPESTNADNSETPENTKADTSKSPESIKLNASESPQSIKSDASSPESINSDTSQLPANTKTDASDTPENSKSDDSGSRDSTKSEDELSSEDRKTENKGTQSSDCSKVGDTDTSDDNKGNGNKPRILKAKNIEELVKSKDTKDKKKKSGEGKEQKKVQENKQTSDISSDFKTCENDKTDARGKTSDKENNANKGNVELKNVSTSLDENIQYLENLYNLPTNKDLIIRKFNIAKRIPACIVYIDGMIDKLIVIQFALPQLMDEHSFRHYDFKCECPLDYIEKNVLTIHQMVRMKSYDEINPQIVSGLAVLFVDGCDECLVMESRGFERRGINPPVVEQVINGPQEGFTETLRTNVTQVRRIVKSENLVTEFEFISKKNNFLCAIMYMEGIANRKVVDEVKRRIKSLDVDYISGSGMLEQLIEDKPYMVFPQIVSTERPDRAASFLMDGKVVIICEGTPFALAMPIVFFDLFHTSEESNLRWQYGTFLRIVRLIGLLLAAFLPGMYTALILFHQEMIPTSLLSSIVASRVNVPFPTFLEILLMEFSFELIREGGIRVPGVTGNTLGIIGALILGQAAVEAGLVSPILIIIVAVSGLGSFAIPNYSLSLGIRIVRISFIVFGQIAGFYGISVAFTILLAFALNLKSFGVPFFAPVAPSTRSNMDKIIRGPVYDQVKRPDYLNTQDELRVGTKPRGWLAEVKGGASRNEQRG